MSMPRRAGARWEQRSRAARKRAFIGMKNKILAHAPQLGGMFTTSDVINNNSWADFYFLSKARRVSFYNGTIDTALCRYFSLCEDQAWDNSERLLGFDPREGLVDLFVPVAGTDYFTLATPKASTTEREKRAFGGLDRYDWMAQEQRRLAESGDIWVSPSVTLHFDYRFGLGLHAVVPDDVLSVSCIHDFVHDFLDRGEKPYELSSMRMSFPWSRKTDIHTCNSIELNPAVWANPTEQERMRQIALATSEKSELSDINLAPELSSESHTKRL